VGPLLSISKATNTQFSLRTTFGVDEYAKRDRWAKYLKILRSAPDGSPLHWIGIEPVTGCRPIPDFTDMYSLSGESTVPVKVMWSLAMKPFGPE
jgi:hypothetical protein